LMISGDIGKLEAECNLQDLPGAQFCFWGTNTIEYHSSMSQV